MDMTDQPQLWTPALEAVSAQAHYEWPYGWSVRLTWRRAGQTWDQEPACSYSELATAEAGDVLSAELARLFDL